MQYRNKSTILGTSLLAVAILISGCGSGGSGGSVASAEASGTGTPGAGSVATTPEVQSPIDVSQATLVTAATKVSGGIISRSATDFSFPEVNNQGGGLSMTIPNGPPPAFPARRTVSTGNGQKIGFGDTVILKYDMFSWASGLLVESSSQFEEAHTVQGGVSDDFPIPEYVAKSLLGRSLGDTVQIVLPVGTEDLPDYLDPADAYVLLVEML